MLLFVLTFSDFRDIITTVSIPLTDTRVINGRVVSIPLTDMRIYKWSGCKYILRLQAEDFQFTEGRKMSEMILYGFYILKDSFFETANDPYLKNNKDGNRPFYYCVKDAAENTDIFWMIPLSSQVDKYKSILAKKRESGKPSDGLYICKLPTGKESAFLIQDIFPITAEYVEREFRIGSNHMILPYEKDVAEIETRAKKVIRLVRRGIKLTPTSPDVMKIYDMFLKP